MLVLQSSTSSVLFGMKMLVYLHSKVAKEGLKYYKGKICFFLIQNILLK